MSGSNVYAAMAVLPSMFGNLISQEKVSSAWGIVNVLYPLAASGALLYLFGSSFKLRGRQPLLAGLPFFLHLFLTMVMGWEPGGVRPFYGLAIFGYLAFLMALCCTFYRGALAKKAYLSAAFGACYLLAMAAMEYTGYGLFHLIARWEVAELGAGACEPLMIFYTCPLFAKIPRGMAYAYAGLCNLIFLLLLAGACGLIIFSSWYLAGKFGRRTWKMGRKELTVLLIPAGAGISFYVFMAFVRPLLFEPAAVDLAKKYGLVLYVIVPALAVGYLAAVLYSCDLLEQMMSLGAERGRSALLQGQVEQLETHIREIEQLYTGIRSMKHDMKNYLFDIQSLLRARGIDVDADEEGLGAYFSGIGEAMKRLDFSFHTGNPITDVIINGKYQQARQLGIQFSCEFFFPNGYGIRAFDIAVILNNALDNALEACQNLQGRKMEEAPFIQIESFCRNSMYFIEIVNRFDGILRCEAPDGAPMTRKDDPLEHGLGFGNINLCAEKYLGKAEYRCSADTFRLTVMLQRVWGS